MSTFQLDKLSIDAIAYGSQGSAILGIRDSGKSYSATLLAEHLFEAGIPFVAFDPIGVWRFLRVPGAGRGYPVVVAGGQDGDLPLTVASAPEIVRAAMTNGVSLVIDLFDINLSKADWKRIVKTCVRVLLHENAKHGLRHVFIEEAAEFVPQRVIDGDVYAAIESLGRMGGNARLGYTLINQRAEEVNKAVLEICDNLFLHRQKGKNSLNSLTKWLDLADVKDHREIIQTLPTLPQGECWAWLAGSDRPVHVKVPVKNSLHPDRRVMRGEDAVKSNAAVDVGEFVASMKAVLKTVETENRENDPKALKAEIARLKRELDTVVTVAAVEEAEARARSVGHDIGYAAGLDAARKALAELVSKFQSGSPAAVVVPTAPPVAGSPERASVPVLREKRATPLPAGSGNGTLAKPLQKILDAVAWWKALGIDAPNYPQVAFRAGYTPGGGTFNRYLSDLRGKDLIRTSNSRIEATAEGHALAKSYPRPSPESLRADVLNQIDRPLAKMLSPLINEYPDALSRDDLGARSEYASSGGTFNRYLSSLRSLELVEEPARGQVRCAEWLFPAGRPQ